MSPWPASRSRCDAREVKGSSSSGPRFACVFLLLIISVFGTACEDARWTAHIGVVRGTEGRLALIVHTCSTDERVSIEVSRDPDLLPDTGDETVLWHIAGVVHSPGISRFAIGVRPNGFAEPTPYVAEVEPSTRYTAVMEWDRVDQGITFVPSEILADRVSSGGGGLVSLEEFRSRAAGYC
jgi:hypothetical protein